MTPRTFLIRGLLAGLVAGLLTFAVGYLVGEPHVDAAIALEEAGDAAPADDHAHEHVDEDHAHSHSHGDDEGTSVSRANQAGWGLLTGTLAAGAAFGGIVGIASAFAVGRLGRLRPTASTALVTAVGFVSVALVPFLKYPATPPAVGDGDTIGMRTGVYFALVAISVVAAIAAVLLGRRLLASLGAYRAVVVACLAYLVVVVIAALLLPTVNEIGDFPADTLWYFRRASLFTLATMWATIGVVLAGLVESLHRRELATQARRDLAASL